MSEDLRARMRALKEGLVKRQPAATPTATVTQATKPQPRRRTERLADPATLADVREAEKLVADLIAEAKDLDKEAQPEMYEAGWRLIYEFLADKPKAAGRFLVEQIKLLLEKTAKRELAGAVVPQQLAEHLRQLEAITGIVRIMDDVEAERLREEGRQWKPIRDRHKAHSAKGEREEDCRICQGEFGPAQVWTFKIEVGPNQLEAVNFVLNLAKGEHTSQAYALKEALQAYWGQVSEKREAHSDWELRHGFIRKEEYEDEAGKKRTRIVRVQGLPTVADLAAGRVEPEQRVRVHIPKHKALQSPGSEGRIFYNWGNAVALVKESGKTVKFRLLLPEGEEADLLGNLHKALGRQSGELFEFVPDPESTRKPFYGLQSKDRRPAERLQRVLTHALRLEEGRPERTPSAPATPKTGEVEARTGAAMVPAVAAADPEPPRKKVARGKAR